MIRWAYTIKANILPIPVNMKSTAGSKFYNGTEKAYTMEEAKEHYRRAANAATKPFIYLSAGVSDAEFRENLEVAIEAGVTQGWHKYVGMHGQIIGLDHFGASAPINDLFTNFSITAESVVLAVQDLINR